MGKRKLATNLFTTTQFPLCHIRNYTYNIKRTTKGNNKRIKSRVLISKSRDFLYREGKKEIILYKDMAG